MLKVHEQFWVSSNTNGRKEAFLDLFGVFPIFLIFNFIVSVDLTHLNIQITYIRIYCYVYVPGVNLLSGRLNPFFTLRLEFLQRLAQDIPDGFFPPPEERGEVIVNSW